MDKKFEEETTWTNSRRFKSKFVYIIRVDARDDQRTSIMLYSIYTAYTSDLQKPMTWFAIGSHSSSHDFENKLFLEHILYILEPFMNICPTCGTIFLRSRVLCDEISYSSVIFEVNILIFPCYFEIHQYIIKIGIIISKRNDSLIFWYRMAWWKISNDFS